MSTFDVLILIPLIPAAPIVITWWLPWERWLFDKLPKYLLGPYLLYAAFATWHFKWESWLVILLTLSGAVLSVIGVLERAKKPAG
jgi:hypothetical protein